MSNLIKQVLGESDELNMEQPEERREVQIGREILRLSGSLMPGTAKRIRELAQELVTMHTMDTKKEQTAPSGDATSKARSMFGGRGPSMS